MESRASTALDAIGLAALRRAAVMAHTVGGISVRLSSGGTAIVEVAPGSCARHLMDPCRFRSAVAKAWADHRSGHEIGLIGLEPSEQLTIDWSVAAPGRDLGLGAVRAACGGRLVWAFASVLPTDELLCVLGALDDDHDVVGGPADGLVARLVHDELLDATVIHVQVDPPVSTRILDEVLRRMMAVVGAAEVPGLQP